MSDAPTKELTDHDKAVEKLRCEILLFAQANIAPSRYRAVAMLVVGVDLGWSEDMPLEVAIEAVTRRYRQLEYGWGEKFPNETGSGSSET